ncbi:lactosylceramide 4-alpha-galactosyltransferase isoform X1 [Drosophila grimshawi]|uniref:GH13060 n=1 Tax=Drosophila grimshawi TaxID=7222 RepID=B4JR54_DROGR|nr:lactosylceramide 4-alpha-galactosyltransferase isoform X1 [Drosophila grimshawi]XP_032595226.1 lactosylceramide 4-alpha-galactosyltransferase isoform X1 [Drosophila grimshawi]EDV99384.1 GH13060 [Drosophila grimshawi]
MAFRLTLLPSKYLMLLALLLGGTIISYKCHKDMQQAIRFVMQYNVMVLQSTASTDRKNVPSPLGDVLTMEPLPVAGRSIFFIETSGVLKPRKEVVKNLLQLTARQACAIESAARHNPNLMVFVLFATPTYRQKEEKLPLIDAIRSYGNVQLRQLNIRRYALRTPINEWVKHGELFSSRYLVSHISDLLRFVTLYRFGGIYLDMDVVVLRSLEDVSLNYAGPESETHLAAGVMGMAPFGFGHEIAEACLRDFQQNFDGQKWGNNGPGVITRVAQKICATKNISLMLADRKRCLGFRVFERNAFYAVPRKHWRHFFEPKYLEETLELTRDSYLVHMWNKHSKQLPIKVGSSTAYGKYAEQHCPKTYAAAGQYF